MTKKTFKHVSILLSLLMALSLVAPLGGLAQENAQEEAQVMGWAWVTAAVECFTIGQGFMNQPDLVFSEKDMTAYDLLAELVGAENILGDSRNVTGIKGADAGSPVIPTYIVEILGGPDTEAAKVHGNPLDEGALGTDSYSDQGQWICLVNNEPLRTGWGNYLVQDNDIIRFAFSYWGNGADVTGYNEATGQSVLNMGNKDELLEVIADLNDDISKYLLTSPLVREAYLEALLVLGDLSNQADIDQTEMKLLDAIEGYKLSPQYRSHIQNKDWEEDWVIGDEMSGTEGEGLRLEAIQIELQENKDYDVGVRYKSHIQNRGWEEEWTENGNTSGTEGQSLQLEAIQIELTGDHAHLFDLYYVVHVQDEGWTDGVKNGGVAGTTGQARRLEGIRLMVEVKDSP